MVFVLLFCFHCNLETNRNTLTHGSRRSHAAVKPLSLGRIYARVITKARWQVADRWQIDGLCPWVRTVPTRPVHQKRNNTVGGRCRVARMSSEPKDAAQCREVSPAAQLCIQQWRKTQVWMFTLFAGEIYCRKWHKYIAACVFLTATSHFWEQFS